MEAYAASSIIREYPFSIVARIIDNATALVQTQPVTYKLDYSIIRFQAAHFMNHIYKSTDYIFNSIYNI